MLRRLRHIIGRRVVFLGGSHDVRMVFVQFAAATTMTDDINRSHEETDSADRDHRHENTCTERSRGICIMMKIIIRGERIGGWYGSDRWNFHGVCRGLEWRFIREWVRQ